MSMITVVKAGLLILLTIWGLIFSPGICISGHHQHECDAHHESQDHQHETECGFKCFDQSLASPLQAYTQILLSRCLFALDSHTLEIENWRHPLVFNLDTCFLGRMNDTPLLN